MDVWPLKTEPVDQGIRKCLIGVVIAVIIVFAVVYSVPKTPMKKCMNPSKITKLTTIAWQNSQNPIVPHFNSSTVMRDQISVLGFSPVPKVGECRVNCDDLNETVVRCPFNLTNMYFVKGGTNFTACERILELQLKLRIKNGEVKSETSFLDPKSKSIRTEPDCEHGNNSNEANPQIKDILAGAFEGALKKHITDQHISDTKGDLWSK